MLDKISSASAQEHLQHILKMTSLVLLCALFAYLSVGRASTIVVPGEDTQVTFNNSNGWSYLSLGGWYDADLDKIWAVGDTNDGQSALGYLQYTNTCGAGPCVVFVPVSSPPPPLVPTADLQLDSASHHLLAMTESGIISIDLSNGSLSGPSFTFGDKINNINFDQAERQFVFQDENTDFVDSGSMSTGSTLSFGSGTYDYATMPFRGIQGASTKKQKIAYVSINNLTGCGTNQYSDYGALATFDEVSGQWSDPICWQDLIPNVNTYYTVSASLGAFDPATNQLYLEAEFTPQGSNSVVDYIYSVDVSHLNRGAAFIADVTAYGSGYFYVAPSNPDSFYLKLLYGFGQALFTDISGNRSWYIECGDSESDQDLYNWMQAAGAALGQRDANLPIKTPAGQVNYSTTVLDFGGMTSGGRASCFGRGLNNAEVESAVENFVTGWESASVQSGNAPYLQVVVGTGTSKNTKLDWLSAGTNWSRIVADIAKRLRGNKSVQILGGIDIEANEKFAPPNDVQAWEQGYQLSFIDYGDLECPSNVKSYGSGDKCGKGQSQWTVGLFATVIGGGAIDPHNAVLPEIYNSKLADEWHLFAQYLGAGNIAVVAPLTQYAACLPQATSSSCKGAMYAPHQASAALTQYFSGLMPGVDIEHRRVN